MTRSAVSLHRIVLVAEALKQLNNQVVFLGGAVVPLLITDAAAPDVRPTLDVDLAVEVTSQLEFANFESELRGLGFTTQHYSDSFIGRYRLGDILVDFMPIVDSILGFTNNWYKLAIRTAETRSVSNNLSVKIITAPCFIATKLEAFISRGKADYRASPDLEDIIKVIDGRQELIEDIQASNHELRDYLSKAFAAFLNDQQFVECIADHLPPDAASQARAPMVLERMHAIARG